MSNIAIIPARGGSKRIHRKNIKEFLGKPIIAYSIEAAIESKLFDEVMVSTDDKEIAEIAINYGANIPFLRSADNSNDFATTFEVIEEVLQEYTRNGGKFEYCCCIYPTAPFVTSKYLHKGFELLTKNNYDSVFPVMQYGFPIQRALKIVDGKVQLFSPEYLSSRSQDLEASFHDAGQFYWTNTERILTERKIITNSCGVIIIEEKEGQDIDNIADWELAELKYKLLNKSKDEKV